jgi:hypothetical protein
MADDRSSASADATIDSSVAEFRLEHSGPGCKLAAEM